MKVLVTGGNGYFGSLLVNHLVESSSAVRVLDVDPTGPQPDGVERGRRRHPRRRRRAARPPPVSTSSTTASPRCRSSRDRAALRSVNVDGTATLLQACRAAGVGKVVHLSSSAVFGIPESNPVRRDTVPKPAEPYGAAKLAAEWACLRAAAGGLDVTIVRPRTIVGHGRLGIFAVLFDWIADGADPFVLGDGSNRYQFVHADDLAALCVERRGAARAGDLQRRDRPLRHDARGDRARVRPRRHRRPGALAAGAAGGRGDARDGAASGSPRSPRTTG